MVIVPVEGRFQEALRRSLITICDLIRLGHGQQRSRITFQTTVRLCAARKLHQPISYWCNPEFDSVLYVGTVVAAVASRIEAYEEAQNIWRRAADTRGIMHYACRHTATILRAGVKPVRQSSLPGVLPRNTKGDLRKTAVIFTLRRLYVAGDALLLTFIGFSLSYLRRTRRYRRASLWRYWVFWFNGLLRTGTFGGVRAH